MLYQLVSVRLPRHHTSQPKSDTRRYLASGRGRLACHRYIQRTNRESRSPHGQIIRIQVEACAITRFAGGRIVLDIQIVGVVENGLQAVAAPVFGGIRRTGRRYR